MPRDLHVLRVMPTDDGWVVRCDDPAATTASPRETFASKDEAISAGVRMALTGGYLVITHEDGTVEKMLPFCKT